MTLHDLFIMTPTPTFVEYYVEYCKVEPEIIDKARKALTVAFDRMKDRKVAPNGNVLLGVYVPGSEECEYDVDLFKVEDIYAWKNGGMISHDEPGFIAEDGDALMAAFPGMPEGYAFEFTDWDEVLSSQVFLQNAQELGELRFIACTFFEMTFCGLDEEKMREKRDEIIKSLEEAEYHASLPPEEQAKYFIPAEEVSARLEAEFGIKRHEPTPEEEAAQHKKICREMTEHRRARYKVLKTYAESLPARDA